LEAIKITILGSEKGALLFRGRDGFFSIGGEDFETLIDLFDDFDAIKL
jgi:hypothetical protein